MARGRVEFKAHHCDRTVIRIEKTMQIPSDISADDVFVIPGPDFPSVTFINGNEPYFTRHTKLRRVAIENSGLAKACLQISLTKGRLIQTLSRMPDIQE